MVGQAARYGMGPAFASSAPSHTQPQIRCTLLLQPLDGVMTPLLTEMRSRFYTSRTKPPMKGSTLIHLGEDIVCFQHVVCLQLGEGGTCCCKQCQHVPFELRPDWPHPQIKFGAWLLGPELHGDSCASRIRPRPWHPSVVKFAWGGYSGRAFRCGVCPKFPNSDDNA